jgi:hypothetical protein
VGRKKNGLGKSIIPLSGRQQSQVTIRQEVEEKGRRQAEDSHPKGSPCTNPLHPLLHTPGERPTQTTQRFPCSLVWAWVPPIEDAWMEGGSSCRADSPSALPSALWFGERCLEGPSWYPVSPPRVPAILAFHEPGPLCAPSGLGWPLIVHCQC